MSLLNTFGIILVMYLLIIVLDYIWLGIVLKDFIISQFGSLIAVKPDGSYDIVLWAGLIAWIFLTLGSYIFAVNPATSITNAIILGATFGAIVYGVFDFTNLTFFKGYPKLFIIVDIIWGAVLCASISAVGYFMKVRWA